MRNRPPKYDRHRALHIILFALNWALCSAMVCGCRSSDWNPTAGLQRSEKPVSTTESPAAIIGGRPVTHDDLFPIFAEVAGASTLRELALDMELERELERRELAVGEGEIEQERQRLTASFGLDEQSRDIARRVFASRQLGPHRLAKLLARNAALRLLIDRPAEVTEASIQIAHAVRHGPKRRVRLMLLGSAEAAAAARREVIERSADSGLSPAFAEIAATRSLDQTAATGGLLGDVSTADPGLSDVLRREIDRATIGTIGDIVAVESGFALVLVEADVPADGVSLEASRDELAATITDRTERLAMESLAEDLIARASITPLAPGLRWSWQQRQGAEASR